MKTPERKSLIHLLEATGEGMQAGLPAAAALEIAIADEAPGMPESLREALADARSPGADPSLRLAAIVGPRTEAWLAGVDGDLSRGAGLALIAEGLPRSRRIPAGAVVIIADLLVLVGLSALVSLYIAPTWIDLFGSLKMTLPALTQAAIVLAYGLVPVSLAMLGFLVVARLWLRRPGALGSGAERIDRLLFRLPGAGAWLRTRESGRAARWLALGRGSPLATFEALAEVGAGSLGGRLAARVANALREGRPLAAALESAGAYLPGFASVLRSAEAHEAQPFDRFLARYGQITSRREVGTLERLILATHFVTGLVIGCYVVAIYLPLFKMGSAV